jgi:SAM-dependent methyltransferase
MRALSAILRKRYETLVRASCSEQPFPIPSATQRYFNNAYSFQYVTAIRRFVGNAQKVLIIGDGGGRDYYSLKLLNKQVLVMDITPQLIIPDMVIADANVPLPFKPQSFDAVVMAEVVEHLPQDYDALRRIRDIVRDDGCLVLTVPYYHDAEPTHVRIHSPLSIERLLHAAGWQIDSYIEKGGGLCRLAGWFPIRMALHGANYIALKVRRKTFFQSVNRRIATFDFWLGRTHNSLHRWSKLYGAFIKCKKARPANCRTMNILAFENMHLKLVNTSRGKNRAPQRSPIA